jgi:Ca2+-binding RTX toxin-like protein
MSIVTVSTTAQLESALKVAQGGETILLGPGTYSAVSISNVHIVGGVTIESQNAANRASISGLIVANSSGLTFSGVTLTTVGCTDPYYSVRVGLSSNITFQGCSFSGPATGSTSSYITGLLLDNNTNVTVAGSTFQHLLNGITDLNNSGVTISNNSFNYMSGDGIDNGGTSNIIISGNQFDNFVNSGTEHPDAIQFWTTNTTTSASNIEISGNTIEQGSGTGNQGIFMSDQVGDLPYQNVTIANNVIVGGMWAGLDVSDVSNLSISGNQLFSIAGSSYVPRLMVSSAAGATLSNNEAGQYLLATYGANTGLVQTNDVLSAAVAANTVISAANYVMPSNVQNVLMVGSANVVVTGNALGDTITGNLGTDTLIGGKGNDVISDGGGLNADTMIGGGGTDTFYVNNSHDIVSESAGSTATVVTTVSFTAPANVQTLTATGTNAVALVGNNLGDTITANTGADTLTGGTSADTFVFAIGQKLETISNFNPANDRIDVSAYVNAGQHITMAEHGTYSTITFGNGDVIDLLGVQASTLQLSGHYIV